MSDNDNYVEDDFAAILEPYIFDSEKDTDKFLSGSACFVDTSGELRTLFSYSFSSKENMFSINPSSLGKYVLKDFVSNKEFSNADGSLSIPLDRYTVSNIANAFLIPTYNDVDLDKKFLINSKENFNVDIKEFLWKVKSTSPLLVGNERNISRMMDKKDIVLKDYVFDSKKKTMGDYPLRKGTPKFRYDNNQLISVDANLGDIQNAFKYAALQAFKKHGFDVPDSKIFRSSEKDEDNFTLITDSRKSTIIPASHSDEAFRTLGQYEMAGKLSMSYQHMLCSNGLKASSYNSAYSGREILNNLKGKGYESDRESFMTSLIFNKLIGASDFDSSKINALFDVEGDNYSMRIDCSTACVPNFAFGENYNGSDIAPFELTPEILASEDPFMNELYYFQKEAYLKSYETATKIRSTMINIISEELHKDGVLTLEEVNSFTNRLLSTPSKSEPFKASSSYQDIGSELFTPNDDSRSKFINKVWNLDNPSNDDLSLN